MLSCIHHTNTHAKLKTKSKSYKSMIGFLSSTIVTIYKTTTVRNAAVALINLHVSISAARVTQQVPGVWVQGVHLPPCGHRGGHINILTPLPLQSTPPCSHTLVYW